MSAARGHLVNLQAVDLVPKVNLPERTTPVIDRGLVRNRAKSRKNRLCPLVQTDQFRNRGAFIRGIPHNPLHYSALRTDPFSHTFD